MSGKQKDPISISGLTCLGIFPSTTGTSNLDDGFTEDTVLRELERFVRLEEEDPCEGRSHGLYFLPSLVYYNR